MNIKGNIIHETPELGCVLCLPGLPGSGNTVNDSSPYGNNGTLTGATWEKLPSGLYCLNFDGIDDEVSISGLSGKQITISIWVNLDTIDTFNGIFGTPVWSTDGHCWLMRANDNDMMWEVLGNNPQTARFDTPFNSNLTGAWHHIACCYDPEGKTYALYLDGVADGKGSYAMAKELVLTDVRIGRVYTAGRFCDGKVALCRVYNRVLTDMEIQNHFEREKHLFGVW